MQSFELERLRFSPSFFLSFNTGIPLAAESYEQVTCRMKNLHSDYKEFFFLVLSFNYRFENNEKIHYDTLCPCPEVCSVPVPPKMVCVKQYNDPEILWRRYCMSRFPQSGIWKLLCLGLLPCLMAIGNKMNSSGSFSGFPDVINGQK